MRRPGALPLLAAALLCACGGASSTIGPQETGTVKVSVSTVGSRLDSDGYTVVLSGQPSRTTGVNDTASFVGVPVGNASIRLTGVAANCDGLSGLGLERTVPVTTANDTDVSFRLSCGPLVLVDEAHFNYPSQQPERYASLVRFLQDHGYVVKSSRARVSRDSLALADVFVIFNALSPENVERWILPIAPAFSASEINEVRDWVTAGGSLLLIADHMPFAGAAEALAATFGVRFNNGFAFDSTQMNAPQDCLTQYEIQVFRRTDGTLADHAITNGRGAAERVDSVATFTGQAFETPPGTAALMTFGGGAIQLFPAEAWVFRATTPRAPAAGLRQGAVLEAGRGRVALFGDGTMFVDKVCGPTSRPNGMNHPLAAQNGQFLLNVLHWLERLL